MFEKRNNFDALSNILIKVEERSMIEISFRTQAICTSIQAQSRIRAKVHSWSTIHSVFKILKTARLREKLTIRALLKAKSFDPKTYSAPSGMEHMFSAGQWELSGHSHEATVTLARRIVRKRSVRVTESSLMVKRNKFCYAIVTVVRVPTIARGKDST